MNKWNFKLNSLYLRDCSEKTEDKCKIRSSHLGQGIWMFNLLTSIFSLASLLLFFILISITF